MTVHSCVVCPVLRSGEPRTYDRPQVCDGCRARLRCLLAELVDCHRDLDLTPGVTAGERVSGTPTDRLPVNETVLDLLLPAHPGTVHDPYGDQAGLLLGDGDDGDWRDWRPSIVGVLDSWARDWQAIQWAHLPAPTVAGLAGWLTNRLDWACDTHPAIADFAAELRALAAVVRAAAGHNHPPAETLRYRGVPCKACNRRALFRWGGEHGRSDYIECGNCGVLLTDDEYHRWVALIAAPAHQPWVRQLAEHSG